MANEENNRSTVIALRKCMQAYANNGGEMQNCSVQGDVVMMSPKHLASLMGCTVVYAKSIMRIGVGGLAGIEKMAEIFNMKPSEFLKLGESDD